MPASPASARTAVCQPAGFDQIAQGMGGLMSITACRDRARSASACRSRISRPDCSRRSASWLRCSNGKNRRRAAHRDLVAAGADFHARFSGRPLSHERRGGEAAGNNHRPAFRRRLQDQGRLHQYRHHRAAHMAALLRDRGRRGALEKPEYETAAARSKNRDALGAEIDGYLGNRTSAEWVERFNDAGVHAARSIPSTDVRRSPGAASRHRAERHQEGRSKIRLVGQRCGCRARRRAWWPGRRNSASIPTQCSRNSASARATSPRCTRPTRYDVASPARTNKRQRNVQ